IAAIVRTGAGPRSRRPHGQQPPAGFLLGHSGRVCVLFGDIDRGRAESPRLLFVPAAAGLAHAEDGVAALGRGGRLSLTAWRRGLPAARRAEVFPLCGRLRASRAAGKAPDLTAALPQLRPWLADTSGSAALDELECVLTANPSEPAANRLLDDVIDS